MATKQAEQHKTEISKSQPSYMVSPFEEMERMFDNFAQRGWLRPFQWDRPLLGELALPFEGRTPNVDIIERDGEILLKAELPGIEKKDLDISITKNSVTIKAHTKYEKEEKAGEYYRCEISRGSFMRSVRLPAAIDEDKAKARFKDGLLELTLPKVEKAHRRTIKVE